MRLNSAQLDFIQNRAWRQELSSTETVAIGIDPGTKTGYAEWDRVLKKFITIETLDFCTVIDRVKQHQPSNTIVLVEVPRTKASFREKNGRKSSHTESVNVGMVYREAQLMVRVLSHLGYSVREIHPQGKVGDKRFKAQTGYSGRTSSHGRDAAMLCFNV